MFDSELYNLCCNRAEQKGADGAYAIAAALLLLKDEIGGVREGITSIGYATQEVGGAVKELATAIACLELPEHRAFSDETEDAISRLITVVGRFLQRWAPKAFLA